jgi:DNA ligase (NAD+)
MPDDCPFCGEPLRRPEGEAHHFCENVDCPNRIFESLTHMASALGARHRGAGGADRPAAARHGARRRPRRRLPARRPPRRPARLGGLGERASTTCSPASRRPVSGRSTGCSSRSTSATSGPTVARTLAAAFGSLEALMRPIAEDIEAVEGIGPIIADAVASWLSTPRNRQLVEELIELGVNTRAERTETSDELAGMTFVVTGTLEGFTRDEAKQALTSRGAKVSGSVSGRTTAVIVGRAPGRSSQGRVARGPGARRGGVRTPARRRRRGGAAGVTDVGATSSRASVGGRGGAAARSRGRRGAHPPGRRRPRRSAG